MESAFDNCYSTIILSIWGSIKSQHLFDRLPKELCKHFNKVEGVEGDCLCNSGMSVCFMVVNGCY